MFWEIVFGVVVGLAIYHHGEILLKFGFDVIAGIFKLIRSIVLFGWAQIIPIILGLSILYLTAFTCELLPNRVLNNLFLYSASFGTIFFIYGAFAHDVYIWTGQKRKQAKNEGTTKDFFFTNALLEITREEVVLYKKQLSGIVRPYSLNEMKRGGLLVLKRVCGMIAILAWSIISIIAACVPVLLGNYKDKTELVVATMLAVFSICGVILYKLMKRFGFFTPEAASSANC